MALNRQKMRTVNSTPMAIEIQRTRASVGGVGPSRSQMVIKTRPITLRNDSIVSTSQAAPATILTSTSETPSTTAAAIPGATGKIEREVKRGALGKESRLTHTRRPRALQPPERFFGGVRSGYERGIAPFSALTALIAEARRYRKRGPEPPAIAGRS